MGSEVMGETMGKKIRFQNILSRQKKNKTWFQFLISYFLKLDNKFFIFFSDFAENTLQSQFFGKRHFEKMGETKEYYQRIEIKQRLHPSAKKPALNRLQQIGRAHV